MKKPLHFILALFMVLSIGTAAFASGDPSSGEPAISQRSSSSEEPPTAADLPQDRICEHVYGYRIQDDSYEATDAEGGYRHYVCKECGKEYAYYTDPLVYADGFVKQDGSVVEVNETNEGSANPNLPLWEHIPDAEPHVFWSKADLEWRVYIYGSHDNAGICGDDHVLWSAPVYDLSDWRYDGEIIRVEADPFDPNSAQDNPSAEPETASEESASEEAASAEAEGSGETGGGMGGMRAGALFAPDCDYDRLTDTYILITFENGKRCAMYRADNPAGRFDDEEPVFCFITGFALSEPVEGEYYCTDPAILIEEDGTAYVMGNINRGVVTDEAARKEMEENGETGTAVIHKLLRDDDGLYYVAGTSHCPTTNGPEHYFSMFEGISIRRDPDTGLYIAVYCNGEYTGADGGGTTSSGLAFAYAEDPMGPWTYGDNGMNGADIYEGLPHKGGGNFGNVLYENGGRHELDPKTGEMIYHSYGTYPDGNDHGGIVKANGQWYVFGHRQSGNGNGGRQNTIQRINLEYQPDGSLVIPIAEMTSTGAAESISAYRALDAGVACYLVSGYRSAGRGGPYVVNYLGNNDPDTNEGKNFDVAHYAPVAGLKDGCIAGYKYLDFAEGGKVTAGILVAGKDSYADGTVQIWIDAPAAEAGGRQVGEIAVSAQAMAAAAEKETGTDGTEWSWLTCGLGENVSGVHAVYYVFLSDTAGTDICMMDQIRFAK